ncbi:apolipoprotein N-acyltransferase [Planctomicrobium sp. SH661]|uniref:apolipoprotein N-acyltransferase n=1 Tax=Planctomicrobium sp. SH661 TaxID=3448124 RepID=UPI003F5C6304
MNTVGDNVADSGAGESPETARRVAEIISRGKRSRPGAITTLALSMLTAVLLWASFTPVDFGPLAWISLVPLLTLVRPAQRTRWMYRIVYVSGLCYWLATLQWMRLGDVSMYGALLALSAYLAVLWPVFLALCRVAVHRFRVPLMIAAPLFWTGLEYLRAHLFTGFAWYFVGHSQYRWVDVIQITDILGAYGVSFLIVLANGAVAQFVPARFFQKWQLCWPGEVEMIASESPRRQLLGGLVSVGLVVLACGYGMARRSHGDFPLGPRVALIQGNYVASVRNNTDDPRDIFLMHRQLTGLTVAEQPDFVVWPEAMFPYGVYEVEHGVTDENLAEIAPEVPVKIWREQESHRALTDMADMTQAALVIGTNAFLAQPAGYKLFNSAVFVQPGAGATNRYDKIHRVPFGEYIPLRDALPFLQSLTPFRGKFGIDKGEQAHVFRWKDWELIPLICFEDTVPQLVRKIAKSAKVNAPTQNQVLVNLTNDGWFHGSSELDQHLITSQFRAIETRTPLVRAVNTGISAVIDGDGVVREALKFYDAGPRNDESSVRNSIRDPRTGRYHKQLNCAIVADVPLDPRTSWYVTLGDWFAASCLTLAVLTALLGLLSKPKIATGAGE